jgi:hypothetical protein
MEIQQPVKFAVSPYLQGLAMFCLIYKFWVNPGQEELFRDVLRQGIQPGAGELPVVLYV